MNKKYVIVTGAFGGMGFNTINLLKEKGFTVFALDKRVNKSEEGIIPIEVDVTSEDSIINAFNIINKYTNNIYAIIHFAGIYVLDSLVEINNDDFYKIFQINVFGAFLINKTFMPLLSNGSKIVITTSELAPLDPLPFTGLYGVTKAALDKYAYSLCMELNLLGISVSVLRAGAVKTNLLNVSTTSLDDFCDKTSFYKCNAKRFKQIVNSVEAKSIAPIKVAYKVFKIINKKHPKFVYNINRNVYLRLLNSLPKKMQLSIIKQVLKPKKNVDIKYKHIVFDIDGTLLDTEYAILHSLQDTLNLVTDRTYSIDELKFVLGITGEEALTQLKIKDINKTLMIWHQKLNNYNDYIKVFDGIEKLLITLKKIGYKLGIVTSKEQNEYNNSFLKFDIHKYFNYVVTASETSRHKPFPDPLLKYMKKNNLNNTELVYIGDSIYDYQCSQNAKVSFIYAKWGSNTNIYTKNIALTPNDVIKHL
ncbi:MAG: SDR family NAD(P)-dependent oxidoreductase [Acholeplasmataceae bacterium]|nr:SDR family NAD(P)-dependent oxidoreductase [Acholeplasmataceae bacterium]